MYVFEVSDYMIEERNFRVLLTSTLEERMLDTKELTVMV